ncbi:hypothetical protein B566_EDAN002218 [Ephemera danica]|nr:hypothetical protein B566_EDAN002218 [Ephemera danica]
MPAVGLLYDINRRHKLAYWYKKVAHIVELSVFPERRLLMVVSAAATCCTAMELMREDKVVTAAAVQELTSEGIFTCPEDNSPLDYAKVYDVKQASASRVSGVQLAVTSSTEGNIYISCMSAQWAPKLQDIMSKSSACSNLSKTSIYLSCCAAVAFSDVLCMMSF